MGKVLAPSGGRAIKSTFAVESVFSTVIDGYIDIPAPDPSNQLSTLSFVQRGCNNTNVTSGCPRVLHHQ